MKKLTPTYAILGGAVLGLAAAYLKNNSTQEIQDHSVGSVSDIQIPNEVKANFEAVLDDVHRQWKHLKKYKNTGSLFVLRKKIELLNIWLDEIK